MSVAVYPSGGPTGSREAEGDGNMSRTYRFSRPGRRRGVCLGSHGALLSLETKTPLQATGEALGARRGGARLGQKQGRSRGADLLHVRRILAAPSADVNSTPGGEWWTVSTSPISGPTSSLETPGFA